jgi:hypothetical protein
VRKAFFILFFLCVSFALYADSEKGDFSRLKTFFFQKVSPQIEQKLITWKNNFISNYGQEAFDSLVERYMKTKEFKELSYKARSLQKTYAAKSLFLQIERVKKQAFYYKTRLNQYHRLYFPTFFGKRDARRESLLGERNLKRDYYQEKYDYFRKEYDQLVKKYNEAYLGCLPFWQRVVKN